MKPSERIKEIEELIYKEHYEEGITNYMAKIEAIIRYLDEKNL